MAIITELSTVDGVATATIRHVPGKSRIAAELKRVFPGARFVVASMTLPGMTEPRQCMELRYNPPAPAKGDAPISAVEIGTTPNDLAMAPLALARHAFRRYGYDFMLTEIVSPKKPLDRIWHFRYVPIKAEVTNNPAIASSPDQINPEAPATKDPTP